MTANIIFIFYVFTIAATIGAALLGIFKSSLFNQLSIRIAILILASVPITLFLIPVANQLIIRITSGVLTALAAYVLIALGTPVILGMFAARFVRRPLRQFNEAVASLEQSNFKVQLQPTGIREFDEVFTKFNNLTNRLQHEERLRKDLVSDTSHELNTPLAIIIGQLTAIQEGKHPATTERITLIKEQAERLAELVEQLDAYTKARVPDTEAPENIHLKQFCKDLLNHFHLELAQKGIAAKLSIPEDYFIHASRSALQQILTNLIQNALRYSGASELTITATDRTIAFADNGKGVPAESLPFVFERFYRVEASRNRNTGGLGLGLAIVHELVEGQGWHIHPELAQPGLRFVITLRPE